MRRSIGSKKVKEERGKEKIYSKKEERRRSIGSAKRDRREERRRSIGSGIEKSKRRARKEKTGYKNFIIRYLPRLKRISFNRSFWS
ncbi:hypothetical protein RchiOBHm_Chr1g0334591 [Rosa chinensis]|uniref:Uncharacterized protein n=1 Tax=Rosa chinensis TaxID=74649 RepID=A0A2P6SCB4_ROSCH|nr:hypothetical protein RchiOBHm_Chr1g0334591 [Rosa chinensis]